MENLVQYHQPSLLAMPCHAQSVICSVTVALENTIPDRFSTALSQEKLESPVNIVAVGPG